MDIKYIQLNNGYELIAHVEDMDGKTIVLVDPMQVSMTPVGSVRLATWIPWCSDEFIEIPMDRVLIVANVDDHMKACYRETLNAEPGEDPSKREFLEAMQKEMMKLRAYDEETKTVEFEPDPDFFAEDFDQFDEAIKFMGKKKTDKGTLH